MHSLAPACTPNSRCLHGCPAAVCSWPSGTGASESRSSAASITASGATERLRTVRRTTVRRRTPDVFRAGLRAVARARPHWRLAPGSRRPARGLYRSTEQGNGGRYRHMGLLVVRSPLRLLQPDNRSLECADTEGDGLQRCKRGCRLTRRRGLGAPRPRARGAGVLVTAPVSRTGSALWAVRERWGSRGGPVRHWRPAAAGPGPPYLVRPPRERGGPILPRPPSRHARPVIRHAVARRSAGRDLRDGFAVGGFAGAAVGAAQAGLGLPVRAVHGWSTSAGLEGDLLFGSAVGVVRARRDGQGSRLRVRGGHPSCRAVQQGQRGAAGDRPPLIRRRPHSSRTGRPVRRSERRVSLGHAAVRTTTDSAACCDARTTGRFGFSHAGGGTRLPGGDSSGRRSRHPA